MYDKNDPVALQREGLCEIITSSSICDTVRAEIIASLLDDPEEDKKWDERMYEFSEYLSGSKGKEQESEYKPALFSNAVWRLIKDSNELTVADAYKLALHRIREAVENKPYNDMGSTLRSLVLSMIERFLPDNECE